MWGNIGQLSLWLKACLDCIFFVKLRQSVFLKQSNALPPVDTGGNRKVFSRCAVTLQNTAPGLISAVDTERPLWVEKPHRLLTQRARVSVSWLVDVVKTTGYSQGLQKTL